MSDTSLEIAKRKLIAIARAEYALKGKLAQIDWEFEYLRPKLKELDKAAANGEIPEFTIEDDGTLLELTESEDNDEN